MSDVKISELVELTFSQIDKFDYIPVVSVNDIAMGDGGSTRKITARNFVSKIISDLEAEWTNSGIEYSGFNLNINNVASAAGSKVFNLSVDDTPIFWVDADGTAHSLTGGTLGSPEWGGISGTLSDQTDLNTALTARVLKAGDTMTGALSIPASSKSAPSLRFGSASNTGLYGAANGTAPGIGLSIGGISFLETRDSGSGIQLHSLWGLCWTSGAADGTVDLTAIRNTTGQLDIRGNSGLRVRNFVNSADAPITASLGTFSTGIDIGADFSTPQTRVRFGTVNPSGIGSNYGNLEFRTGSGTHPSVTYTTRFAIFGSSATLGENYPLQWRNASPSGGTTLGSITTTASPGNLQLYAGGTVRSLAASGFASRNAGNTADAPITCSSFTASSEIRGATRITSGVAPGLGSGFYITSNTTDIGSIFCGDGALNVRGHEGNGVRYWSQTTHQFRNGDNSANQSISAASGTFTSNVSAVNGTFSGNVALSNQANQFRIGTMGSSGPGIAVGCGTNGSADIYTYNGQNIVASFWSTNAASPGLCFRNGHGVYFSSAATPDANAWDAAVLRSTNVVVTAADNGLNVLNKAQSARATLRASIGDFNNSVVISAPAITGRETILRASVTDSGNDAFHIYNATGISNSFAPGFSGSRFSSSLFALGFIAQTDAANDTGSEPLMIFEARQTDSTTDPNNGTLSAITTRPLFRWQTFGTNHMIMFSNGNLSLNNFVDSGHKLQVNGNVSISGALSTGTITTNPGFANSQAFGPGHSMVGTGCTLIGTNISQSYTGSTIGIGYNINAAGRNSVYIGNSNTAPTPGSVVSQVVSIGDQVTTGTVCVAVGSLSNAGTGAVCIGYGATNADGGVTIGREATGTGSQPVVIGYYASAASRGIAIGRYSSCGHRSIVIGDTATSTADQQLHFGSSQSPISVVSFPGATFNRINLGDATSANPAIKRNGTGIDFRTADDASFCSIASGAITSSSNLTITPSASVTPASNGQLTFEATSNTSLTIKYKGNDGIVRSVALTLS